jgi:cytochrome bd-type quinol oxidase subunit 2
MTSKQERWATVATGAVIAAVMAATWLLCENTLRWRDTFRLEDLTSARDQVDDFEAYRPDGVFASAPSWVALVVLLVAVVLAVVAGVRSGRWRPVLASACAVLSVVLVLVGTVLPVGVILLLGAAIPVTLAVRGLAAPTTARGGVETVGRIASNS